MLFFNVNLTNPWSSKFKSLKVWHGQCGRYRAWEVQIMKTNTVLEVEVGYTVKQDHAGLTVELGLFGYNIQAQYYDCRHWDHDNNCWQIYGDQK